MKQLQRELFRVSSAVANPPGTGDPAQEKITVLTDALEAHVHRIEKMPGILGDWSLPGELPDAAALDVARTVCRRAERLATQLLDAKQLADPAVVAYLNRLSDLLWLLGRLLETRQGVDSSLRPKGKHGGRWSRAW